MLRKSLHWVGFVVERVIENAPAGFGCGHVACVQVFRNFVGGRFHAGAIVTFVRVLVKVLHGFNGCANFHVDVAIEYP